MTTQTFSNQMPLKGSFMPLNSSIARKQLWAGRVITGLTTLFMLMDGIMKVVKPAPVVEASGKLGYPEATLSGIGFALIVCTLMYAIDRKSIFGAILLTGDRKSGVQGKSP